MSSLESKDQTTEENETKSEKVTDQCGLARASKLSTHVRSHSISVLKSKIPTNISHAMRSGQTVQSPHPQPVSSDDGAIGKTSSANSGGLPASKSLTVASTPSVVTKTNKSSSNSTGNSTMQSRLLESQFSTKKKRYVSLRKELTEKQKNATELYSEISQIREKLLAKGCRDPGKVETLNFPSAAMENNLASVGNEGGRHLDGSGEHASGPAVSLTNEFLAAAVSKIRELPKRFSDLCNEMLLQRSEIIKSLEKIERAKEKGELEVLIAKEMENLKNHSVSLESRFEEAQKLNDALITETIEKLSTLWNELESSNEKILQLQNNDYEIDKEIHVKLDNAMREKKLAEAESARLREREISSEAEVLKLRTKLREMETKISEGDQKIARLQNHAKHLEMQLKQKDSNADKLKDMEKSLKNSQSLLTKTEKQRDCLETKLAEMKKHLGSKEKESENKIKQISSKLAEANLELAKQRGERGDAATDKNDSLHTSDRRLAERDEKIKTLQLQKQEIIRAVDPGLLGDDCDLASNDADEAHTKIVYLLKKSFEVLRLESDSQKEKAEKLQQQLRALNSGGHYMDKPFTAQHVKDLEKQLNELRASLKEYSRRNKQLELALGQKELECEKQTRILKERNNIMKVRDEVIDLVTGSTKLRDKSLDSHRSSMNKGCHFRERDQVDRQIAEKTENLQELYSTLESKQMQITRLEQLVEQMEIQQERAQEQRTRLEKKIAQLQLAMHCRKGHRSRGWLSIL
ncbi:putative leucine-rich repeat-containing protein DDB_G0290503 [Venturia canescens]|uniref:putative leucine-rich repeat-containing protein DDB_G0290503 n=1 Tax=Venturia canescens TaxID=32260 RepID=UPI001C9CF757|nr:putative leucine-rich repeat-containing protein DDB_G0290503 [Venturia canescens]XP_043268715.1 putative leucine-rich repeat-containing protein DDB_G0290503 [Venturia canescens]XP_043268716.1 putative leucine-rich repeat-containing protein DDB_G0290503 [Venturia canescens]